MLVLATVGLWPETSERKVIDFILQATIGSSLQMLSKYINSKFYEVPQDHCIKLVIRRYFKVAKADSDYSRYFKG